MAERFAAKGNLKGVYAIHFLLGNLIGCALYFVLCATAFYMGVDAVKGLLDMVPEFVINGFGVAANILPAMGFAMLGRLVLTKQVMPYFFLGFLITSYAGVPVLGVAVAAIIIAVVKFDLLNPNATAAPALASEGDDDDDF